MPDRASQRAIGLGFVAALLVAMFGSFAPAWAGVGLAVVLDLPPAVKVGDRGLAGSLTITNINSSPDDAATNLVSNITVTPTCGSRAVAGECPSGWEDPGVIAIDPVATGRYGSACGGTMFTVAESNSASGQMVFDTPEGGVTLGPVAGPPSTTQCVIDFTFSVADVPAPAEVPGTQGTETTAYAGAWVLSAPGMRRGIGGNYRALTVH